MATENQVISAGMVESAAVLDVMKQVSYQKKTSARGLPYTFAGIEDLIAQLRPAMIEAGLALVNSEVQSLNVTDFTNAKGNRVCCATVRVRYVFSGPNGAVGYEGAGYAQDTSDKAVAKAMTAALKCALRQGFLIETGDTDQDRTSVSHVQRGTASPEETLERAYQAIAEASDNARLDRLHQAASQRGFDKLQMEQINAAVEARRTELLATPESGTEPDGKAAEPKSLRG